MGYHILIADDEERIVLNMKQIIEAAMGDAVTVYTASNGIECIGMIKRERIDFLITDICMPGLNGVELVRFIRDENKEIQILVISAYEDFNYAKQLIPYHVLDYLVKPIRMDQILAKIKYVMNMQESGQTLQKMETEDTDSQYYVKSLIKDAKKYIRQEVYKPISLVDVAEYLHVNKSYLSTMFKNETGVNISVYINNEKVKEAKKMLLETEMPVTEIAERLGYSTPKYFVEKFAKSTGITPAKYRSLLNKNIR